MKNICNDNLEELYAALIARLPVGRDVQDLDFLGINLHDVAPPSGKLYFQQADSLLPSRFSAYEAFSDYTSTVLDSAVPTSVRVDYKLRSFDETGIEPLLNLLKADFAPFDAAAPELMPLNDALPWVHLGLKLQEDQIETIKCYFDLMNQRPGGIPEIVSLPGMNPALLEAAEVACGGGSFWMLGVDCSGRGNRYKLYLRHRTTPLEEVILPAAVREQVAGLAAWLATHPEWSYDAVGLSAANAWVDTANLYFMLD